MDLIWPDMAYISLQILSIIKEYYDGPARQFNKKLKLFQTYKIYSKNSPNMAILWPKYSQKNINDMTQLFGPL